MTLGEDVNLDDFITSKDELSGADIKVRAHWLTWRSSSCLVEGIQWMKVLRVMVCLQAMCTEAGLLALRERRMRVTMTDFEKSKENVLYRKKEGAPEALYL